MGLIYSKNRFSSFSSETSIRFDYLFNNSVSLLSSDFYTYKELFDIIEYEKMDISSLETFKYAEIGNVEKTGDVIPESLSFSERNELNENLFKKIEKGDIILPQKGDILLSAIRPYLNKNVLIKNETVYFTKAFIQIRPKINSSIFYYSLRNLFFENLNAVSRQGKGYPTLKSYDLKTIRFPKNVIDSLKKEESKLINKISPLEKDIELLKASKKVKSNIINKVFSDNFKFDSNTIKDLEREKTYKISFTDLNNSIDFRSATKFHSNKYDFLKLKIFNQYTFKDFAEFMTLGRQIKPEHFDKESDYFYLMPNAIKNNKLNEILMKSIKFSFFNKLKHISLKYNDLILAASGEGTIGKSAIYNSDKDAVSSQFIMKIELKNKELVQYFHYYMQSTFFQFTVEKFKKGMGNMTNIFVSQVKDFPVLFDKILVTKIVNSITKQIDEQKEIDKKIEQKQNEIKELIENAIVSE